MTGIRKFSKTTASFAAVPAKPASEPTDFPLKKSLGRVWMFPTAV